MDEDQNKLPDTQDATTEAASEMGELAPVLKVGEDFQSEFGIIRPVNIVEEVEKSYLDYAMSVIVSRALPDVRDGLKPVHRRILYAMHEAGIIHSAPTKKSARVVGDVMGKYHPHGDAPVYDALVRLAQSFSMRYPLIDGQGNFGSIDGDPPAAMRYTEARLSKIAAELLSDLDKETVEFADNFDASLKEPTVLPAMLPNLLLMGSDGIAVGMATKMPPHNLKEVTAALVELIQKGSSPINEELKGLLKDPETDDPKILVGEFESTATLEDLLTHIKGPDFPTGAEIFDKNAIKEMYATGKGKIMIRAVTEIIEHKSRFAIRVTQLPYQVNKANLIAKIADLHRQKKIEGISDLRDESDRQGLTIMIELKKDARPQQVLNNLFKHTDLQTSFPANFVALDPTLTPRLMTLKQIANEYVKHRQLVVVRRSQYELKAAKARAHILQGLLKALDIIDEVIDTIRKSQSTDDAKKNLVSKFGFSEIQAQAILDMQLRKLAALERQKIQDEYNELMKRIDFLIALINNTGKILNTIIEELKLLAEKYGDNRRTKVHPNAIGEFSEEELITAEETIVTLTKTGYIKRMPPSTFRSQRRGGKGVSGMSKKDEDEIYLLTSANTHDNLLVFTSKGKVFKLRVWELPEGSRTSKGQAIINLLNIEQGETIRALLPLPDKLEKIKDEYFFFTSKKGLVKRTKVSDFANIKSNGLIAIKLASGDELVWTNQTGGVDHILLVTHEGKSIHFPETDVRPTGRDTMGVRGIMLTREDFVITMECFSPHVETPADKRKKFFRNILVITQKGLGKRTPLDEYPVQKRGGQGVKVSETTDKTGKIAAALLVNQNTDEIIITTKQAQAIKLPVKNIPILKRPTQGVILMRFAKPSDIVTAVAALDKEEEERK